MTRLQDDLMARARPDIEKIEKELKANLTPYFDLVAQTAGHLMFAGGKRLRPLLIVLSARICGFEDPFVYRFAGIFEYLHTATLLHDDVVDGASIRRGKPVAHSIWGAPTAVLTGDFLLARALSIASETRNPKIISVVAEVTEQMSQGEIYQLMKKGDLFFSENEYFDVIMRKTGVLIQGACRTGAMLAGARRKWEDALAGYGRNMGIVFQIADDILDYTADTEVLGKAVGADLREGKLTLPVIYALKNAGEKDRTEMEGIICRPDFTKIDFIRLIELINKYNGIDYSKKTADAYLKRAQESLSPLPSCPARDLLVIVAEYALKRDK
ncbi:MAG: polyprenyl synthetase family protein [Deltaproteobacteria bacterium]|nr:polyprenyl synthetase family protein [Deltaproteobacteria bacterium]